MWVIKHNFYENAAPQISQENSFCTMCVHVAFQMSTCKKKAEPQTSKAKGLSLTCAYMWQFKGSLLKILIHRFYKKMVSLLYVFACGFLNSTSVKMQILTLHQKIVSLQHVFTCWNSNNPF